VEIGVTSRNATIDKGRPPWCYGPVARALRIERAGGRYHLSARGNERRDIFRDERDRQHFLDLLAGLPERFGSRLHAYVLMPNHYHLLVETPEGNLSRLGQWLNVSYSVWFNRRHQRSGHLFQGRFAAILIEDDAGFQEVGRYVHLNPVRILRLGLDKRRRAIGRLGLAPAPSREAVQERLGVLRAWRWSSYPAYAGWAPVPQWLSAEVLGRSCGGRTAAEKRTALRAYTESAVREGLPERPWERLIGGVILGSERFARAVRAKLQPDEREQPGARQLSGRVNWEQIVQAVESAKGESWAQFRDRHGDWGRDVALWVGRRLGRLKLRELAQLAGGLDYTTAGAAVNRISLRLAHDETLRRQVQRIERQLSNFEM
jgi:putative transposase